MELSLLTGGTQRTLETVRILHETVLALRAALEGSRQEIHELRKQNSNSLQSEKNDSKKVRIDENILYLESMENIREEDKKSEDGSQEKKNDSEPESDDIDDIELVFTTGETDVSSIHEDLVPIIEENVKSMTNSVLVETDISKCGVIDEHDLVYSGRRNTLPDPMPYQPIIHREILAAARKYSIRSPSKALNPGTHDIGAQTDITALPPHWKSETYLAHKINYNLTTLPSKFTLPVPQTKRFPLSDKTREARRVLLSDINFTSMVPELSRSADHLHDDKNVSKPQQSAFDYVKSPRTEKCCEYSRQESRSSCGSYYGSRCYTSSTSIPPFMYEDSRRRHICKPHYILCCRSKHIWSSVPSSPIKCSHDIINCSGESFYHLPLRNKTIKTHFHSYDPCRQSMPNLRIENESGESTDSLVEEAEEFLRRSIDNLLLSKNYPRRIERRISETDSTSSEFLRLLLLILKYLNNKKTISGFEPPKESQPFLPKTPKDLKRDSFVKVITPEGRIAVGRVRYNGLVPGRPEPFVGVELANASGFSDGTFMGHHFFDW